MRLSIIEKMLSKSEEAGRHPLRSKLAARLLRHVRVPLYRNAYAWMLSTGISSGLGIVYWILAGRLYNEEIVGVSAAFISAMIFISGISQLNLMSALIRFVPVSGKHTGRLVTFSYLIAVTAAGLVAALVLGGYRLITGGKEFLNAPFQMVAWLVPGAMVYSIFNLQDSVLTGLRETVWVPIENIFFAVVKIIMLFGLAKVWPQYGIFASWILPIALVIVPLNLLIYRRLIPRHVRNTVQHARPLVPRYIARYIAGNYLGSLFLLGSTRLLPVLVTGSAGARAGAYFFLAWTMANALKLITTNMAMSLTVEGARDQSDLRKRVPRFLVSVAAICIPAIAVLVVGAPYILRLSGNSYSVAGAGLLRLLALSVIPSTVTTVYISVARVRNLASRVALVQGAFCGILLLLSSLLLKRYGITGVGYAFIISESVVAGALVLYHRGALGQVRQLWSQRESSQGDLG